MAFGYTEEEIQNLRIDCLGVKEYYLSALYHPTNHPRIDIDKLQSLDDNFRLACRYPKYLGGEAFLTYKKP